MKVTVDENGICLPDVKIEAYVKDAIDNNRDIHTSQALMLDVVRAYVLKIPDGARPDIVWTVYGTEVKFDKHLRSFDAWQDERMNVGDRALNSIIMGCMKKSA